MLILLLISILIMGYLGYVMVKPEKF
ncbi:MAG: potassium-transporting ATPase subunit F [Bacteroidia bacterium]|nr:potassium-transporting ATPase subunit F [Bacteroidia bacterium]